MRAAELAERVRSELAARADPLVREGARRFCREEIEVWGVRAPAVKQIARAVYHEVKSWPAQERDALAGALWRGGRLEESGAVIYVYRRLSKQFGKTEFRLFETWLDRYVNTWANCDGLASWLLSAAVANDPSLISHLTGWTRSRNRWKRRAAIVSLLQEAKQGRHTREILGIAKRLIADDDDMVQKGVGWVLKEAYPKKPRAVVEFLKGPGADANRLVLRIAAEKMNPRDRAATLSRPTKK